ncbi:MAG TPA: F0F1 ATP synthase subunit alpha, partial [bacterium]|nr:F0F1 ATP synthase subunit alpha [bacterium]
VSRVGSTAQIKAMKKVAGKMRLEAAQYRELAAFAQFGSDLDEDTKNKLERGKRLYEIFKQDQYTPLAVAKQVIVYYSLINGLTDNVPVEKMREFEAGLMKYTDLNNGVIKMIDDRKDLDEEIENEIKKLVDGYKATLDYLIK